VGYEFFMVTSTKSTAKFLMAAYDLDELLSDSPVATPKKHTNRFRCCRRRLSSPGISDHGTVNLPEVLALLPVNEILAFTSLQILSMTSKTWLKQAYSGASAVEVEVDMKDWPFSVTE